MAEFTADGNSLDKYSDLTVFPWKAGTLAPNPNDGAARQGVNEGWNAEIGSFCYSNGGADIQAPPLTLGGVDGDIIIMGHGNYGDRIGKDAGYTHSARSLAKLLADGGLAAGFAGKIILWSCFGGVSAARSLKSKLAGRGFVNLTVWGCNFATANIAYKTFYHYPASGAVLGADGTLTYNAGIAGGTAETTLADMTSF